MNNLLRCYRVITERTMQEYIFVYVNAWSEEDAVGMVAKELGYDALLLRCKEQAWGSDMTKIMSVYGRGYMDTRGLGGGLQMASSLQHTPFVRVYSREEKIDKLLGSE